MARIYKCTYCKKPIDNPDELVEFTHNNVTKRSHKQCRAERLTRKEFLDYFSSILNLPPLTKQSVMIFENYNKKGYTWEVQLHALKEKAQAIIKNFGDKSWGYIIRILENQYPISYKIIESQKLRQQEIKRQMNKIEVKEIRNVEYKPQTSEDASDFLD